MKDVYWITSSGSLESVVGVPVVVTYNPPPEASELHFSNVTLDADVPMMFSFPFDPRSAYTAPPLEDEEHEEKEVEEIEAEAEAPVKER